MPKVTLTFNLPEEESELQLVRDASKLASIIYEFTCLCRNKTKYGSDKDQEQWEVVRDEWWKILNEAKYDPYEG